MRCNWCGEELKFERGRGWLHPNGELYKTRRAYPRICLECGKRLTNGYCSKCDRQYPQEQVDDHIAMPVEI